LLKLFFVSRVGGSLLI